MTDLYWRAALYSDHPYPKKYGHQICDMSCFSKDTRNEIAYALVSILLRRSGDVYVTPTDSDSGSSCVYKKHHSLNDTHMALFLRFKASIACCRSKQKQITKKQFDQVCHSWNAVLRNRE